MRLLVQLPQGVLSITIPGKRLFSITIWIFVMWVVGASILLFTIASIYMRNQVRPLRRLAKVVDAFGKGQDESRAYTASGAKEIRQAALAFNFMRERIRRQMRQRTDMLSAISHDLRTPITRMLLETELMQDEAAKMNLRDELGRMQTMVEAYLAFARGQGEEKVEWVKLNELVDKMVVTLRQEGHHIDQHIEGVIHIQARPIAMRRLLDNLLYNAVRYADNVRIYVAKRKSGKKEIHHQTMPDMIEMLIDDNGPGIEPSDYERAFQPFTRLDTSRGSNRANTGLGLSIVRDIVHSHGGQIQLETSPLGGLRVRIRLPE